MPVTIEPIAKENAPVMEPVTFEKYSETLQLFHAEFIRIAVEYGWDKPSAMLRRITLEFPERRNSKVTPAKIGEGLTRDMFTPDGWAAFTAKNEKEYAVRLALFRKRLLRLASEGYFDTDVANRILKAAGLPLFDQPKGFQYVIGSGPSMSMTHENRSEREVREEVQAKFAELFAANGWIIRPGYSLPAVSQRRGPVPIPADETAPLL